MPIVRPQFNKTLQRVKMQSQLDSVMDFTNQHTLNSARALKVVATLFDKTIQHLKCDTMEEFFKKQPQIESGLNSLVALIEEFKKGLDNLKDQSPILKDFLETVKIEDIEKNASEFIDKLQNLTITDSNGHSNGNGVKANGNSNGSANGSNGNAHGDLIIDPLKWEPVFPNMHKDRPLTGHIAHIENPSDFYIHPNSGTAEFVMKTQREQALLIQKGITSLPPIQTGMYIAARFHEDFYWYRARIIEVFNPKGRPTEIEKVKVFYLDYGNTSEVTLDNIMPLASSLGEQKVMALNCRFVHYDPENGWSEEATQALKEKVPVNSKVKVYFSKPSPKISHNGEFPFYPVDLLTPEGQKVFEVLRAFTKTA